VIAVFILLIIFVFLFVTGIATLAIVLEHRQKMAGIKSDSAQIPAASADEVRELRELVVNLSLAVEQMRTEMRPTSFSAPSETPDYTELRQRVNK